MKPMHWRSLWGGLGDATRISLVYALVSTAWVLASDSFVNLVATDPAQFASLQTYKGVIFVAVTALVIRFTMAGVLASTRAEQNLRTGAISAAGSQAREKPLGSAWVPLGAFVLLAAVSAGIGYFTYDVGRQWIKKDRQHQLAAIADLKVKQIATWMEERRKDAQTIIESPFFGPVLGDWLQRGAPADETRDRLLLRLTLLHDVSHYRAVVFLDAHGEPRLGAGDYQQVEPYAQQKALEAMRARAVSFSDLHAPSNGSALQAELGLFAPLLIADGANTVTMGALYFKIDPAEYLYPLIQSWPTPSPSAETLLVRREGDSVLFLNELRHREHSALQLRVPLSNALLPAARAVSGQLGAVEGVDYSGIPVLAVTRKVPNSPWYMVAKVDADEALAPLRQLTWAVGLLVVVLISAAGGITGLWWHKRVHEHLAREYRAQIERDALTQHFDYLSKYANDIILLMNADADIIEANDRACAAYGYTRDDLLGRNIRALRDPTTLTSFDSQWQSVPFKGGLIFETVHIRKDGSIFPVEVSSRMFEIDGQRFYQSIVRDITERKQAEERLRESEQRFRSVFNNAAVGVAIVSPEGHVVDANDGGCRFFGYPREELLGMQFSQLTHREDVSLDAELYQDLLRGAIESYDVEKRCMRKDGQTVWGHLNVSVVRGEQGQVQYTVLVCQDITEAKLAQERLLLWSKVLEYSAQGILITDAQVRIVQVNRAFTEITGFTPEEVQGQNPRLLKSGRHDREFYQNMWAALREAGHWQGEIWNRRKSGEIYPQWMSISAVTDQRSQVTHYVSILYDISERKAADERIRYLAYYDGLTGLANRALLHAHLEQAIADARRYQTQVGLLFLDLDQFKNINDSLGHSVGDRLLQLVGQRLRGCVREGDTVARLGGDEFVIVAPDLEAAEDAAIVAQTVFQAMARPCLIDGHELSITLSMGISVYPHDGTDIGTLIKNADAAMYHAKGVGRNNYQFYTQDMNARALEMLAMENRLRHALRHGELMLHYQPQVEIASGRIVGTEALLRWQPPGGELVMPGKIIPIAEERGLIVPIGDWMVRTACEQNRRWQAQGLPAIPVAVNISALQFRQKGFVEKLRQVLQETGLDPKYLELELTESIIMHDAESTIGMVRELKAIGLKLSIDDFGTGYSSLNYLRRFPIDQLKIDHSFVRDMLTNSDAAAITRVTINLAKTLNLRVIAEAVELSEQMEMLRAQGCDEIQGYYVSRPLPAEDYAALLHASAAGKGLCA